MPNGMILNAPIDVQEVRAKAAKKWQYRRIRLARGITPRPVQWMNPYWQVVASRQQGDRGTCVGQSHAVLMDLIHVTLTHEQYTGTIVRDVDDGLRDQLYDQSFSAECIYELSREEAGITGSEEGSYVADAIKALQKKGICLERQWWTVKDPKRATEGPYPASKEECMATCEQHRIEGRAAITTIEEMKDAIYEYGAVTACINVYANCTAGGIDPADGLYRGDWPDPAGELIGSHALVFIGYDEARVYFMQSWRGWKVLGSISNKYWTMAGGDCWAPLDKSDTTIGDNIYKKVVIEVTGTDGRGLPATLTVDNKSIGESPVTVNWLIAHTYNVRAEYRGVSKEQIVHVDDGLTSVVMYLETSVQEKSTLQKLLDRLESLLRALFNIR